MTLKETLATLQSLADEKVKKQHQKNGAGENLYGVKLGDIRNVAKKIKTNHALAMELWQTENIDARLLAVLIMDIKQIPASELEQLVQSLNLAWLADWLNSYIVKEHPDKEKLREKWMKTKNVWAARAGWSLTAGRVARDAGGLDLPALLDRIEKEMSKAAPEVQWTMNSTLVQIGIHFPEHRSRALAIGEKLGIYRDYPVSKGCTSPFAPIWINEMVSRQGKS